MRILIFWGMIMLTQCGVRRDPIPQHTQDGPHSDLKKPSKAAGTSSTPPKGP